MHLFLRILKERAAACGQDARSLRASRYLVLLILVVASAALPARADRTAPPPRASAPTMPTQAGYVNSAAGVPDIAKLEYALEYTGAGAGIATAIEIRGNIAYLAESNKLLVLDISDPADPALLGEYGFPIPPSNEFPSQPVLDVSGSYAYVGIYELGDLHIIDVSNPRQPTSCYKYRPMSQIRRIDADGSLAHVLGNEYHILDVSNPCAPVRRFASPGSYASVVAAGTLAYLTGSSSDLTIMDVSNPAAPVVLSSYNTPGSAKEIVVVGTRAYIADEPSSLTILDVGNPAAPVLLGTYTSSRFYNTQSLAVAGSLAYVVTTDDGLQIINVANPAAPVLVGVYGLGEYFEDVEVAGSFAYLAAGWDDLLILDVSQPNAPKLHKQYRTLKNAYAVHVEGSLAYIGSGRLDIVDISQLANPRILSIYQPRSGAHNDVEKAGSRLYLAGDSLEIVDVQDPQQPAFLGGYTIPPDPITGLPALVTSVRVNGTRAYIGTRGQEDFNNALVQGSNGLVILDVSDPTRPRFLARYATSAPVHNLQIVGARAYLATGNRTTVVDGELVILDITDSTRPVLLGSFRTGEEYANDIQVVGDIAYLSNAYSGLDIIDISRPAAPTRIGYYPRPFINFPILALQVDGPIAYLMGDDIEVLNVSDPTRPTLHSTYPTPGYVEDMQRIGDQIYVADGTGLSILRVERDLARASITTGGGSLTNKINTTTIIVPPNAVDSTIVMSYTGFLAPTRQLPEQRRVVRSFKLEAQYPSGVFMPSLSVPYTISLRYTQRHLSTALALESSLAVVVWGEESWIEVPRSQYTIDTSTNTITLTDVRAGEFALIGSSAHTYLSLMRR